MSFLKVRTGKGVEKGTNEDRCLSHPHIRAQVGTNKAYETAKLVVFPHATLVKVVRETVVKVCPGCGGEFTVETFKESFVVLCPKCRGITGHTRGEVVTFSPSSRRRLMLMLNSLRTDLVNVSFVTLTFPDSYFPFIEDVRHCKELLRKWEFRFRRHFPGATFVWRLEHQDRKSGKHIGTIFPHFHLLVFGVQLGVLRRFVASEWHEIAGCGEVEHLKVHQHVKTVTPVLSRRGILRYASKGIGNISSELAKTHQVGDVSPGRFWGICVREVFRKLQDVAEEYQLGDLDAVHLMRLFRRYMKRRRAFTWRSLNVFISGAFVSKNLLRMIAPGGRWRFKATGRRYDEKFLVHAYNQGWLGVPVEG